MWGIKGNLDVEVHEGDFRTHTHVAKRLREADVVVRRHPVESVILLMHLFG